jgi:hypothetical protein
MQVVDQDLSSVLGGHPEPSANGFIFVAGDLLRALKLPRRITTSRVRATSATQAIHRRAQGNERPQF